LNEARDRGVSQAAAIARARAAAAGWPTELAVRYLTHHLMYRLTDEARAGLARFLELAGELGWLDRKHEVAS
jgi:predicted solute-binding protein